jgi:hypothetical protein
MTSALDGDKWSASRPARFTLRERATGTNWIGDCVGPRVSLAVRLERGVCIPPEVPEGFLGATRKHSSHTEIQEPLELALILALTKIRPQIEVLAC